MGWHSYLSLFSILWVWFVVTMTTSCTRSSSGGGGGISGSSATSWVVDVVERNKSSVSIWRAHRPPLDVSFSQQCKLQEGGRERGRK